MRNRDLLTLDTEGVMTAADEHAQALFARAGKS
jgi:hypothetical protein